MAHLEGRVQGLRLWNRIYASGKSEVIREDKVTMMMMLKFDLPAHDFRLLDPSFAHPSTILGRDKAIVVSLEHIRGIITADEVLFLNFHDPHDPLVCPLVLELQRRLNPAGVSRASRFESADLSPKRGWTNFRDKFGITWPKNFPFEFKALEVMLQAVCTHLDLQAAELQREGLSLLDELASKISTSKLERVRQLKSTLVATTRRVQKVRDEIEQLVNDKGKLAEMYLTQKKQKMESTSHGDQSLLGNRLSVSVPVSPVASPRDGRKPEKSFSIESRHEGIRSSESVAKKIELEMLLVTFLVVTDNTFNKLTSVWHRRSLHSLILFCLIWKECGNSQNFLIASC
ncbi:hypothetical protein EUGRSUZ_J03122 [Eucalyptus grandis]|uniref:Uncharacterized protein n=2 Tax=Eucalyptus grandis TaxID=71139 RepID=A0ACC3JAL4_EUCGR|nr:hypothetical protein EUGRSUZ_J03122 [Eucalyptus grandis]